MGTHEETLVGAFLNDDPLIDLTELDPSLDAVLVKDEHAVLLMCLDTEEGLGGVGNIVAYTGNSALLIGILVIIGECVFEIHVHLCVGDVFKAYVGVAMRRVLPRGLLQTSKMTPFFADSILHETLCARTDCESAGCEPGSGIQDRKKGVGFTAAADAVISKFSLYLLGQME